LFDCFACAHRPLSIAPAKGSYQARRKAQHKACASHTVFLVTAFKCRPCVRMAPALAVPQLQVKLAGKPDTPSLIGLHVALCLLCHCCLCAYRDGASTSRVQLLLKFLENPTQDIEHGQPGSHCLYALAACLQAVSKVGASTSRVQLRVKLAGKPDTAS
jgi:hypothetical protein